MKFGEFEVDERAGVLRRAGTRIKLQDLPFRLLVVLLRRPGQVVTREELRKELWGSETFVDAEAGLNTAIAKIREALGDNAEKPAFIETLPKRGYRFVGTLESSEPGPTTSAKATVVRRSFTRRRKAQPPTGHPLFPGMPTRVTNRRAFYALAVLAVAVLAIALYIVFSGPAPTTIAVVRFHNETGAAENDRLAGTLTDAVVVALAGNPKYGIVGNSPLLVTERIFEDVGKIGEALKADYVVLGQLQKGDAGLLTRAHFIRVSDQTHLWADSITLPAADMERVLAAAVVEGVGIGLDRSRETPALTAR
jgi:DNA-binding winged helix-turn-helix (wHTH) protein/TolB-like protein